MACKYCEEDGIEANKRMFKIMPLKSSVLYLARDQTYEGRCNIVFSRHVEDMCHLSEEERAEFFENTARVAKVLHRIYHPDKVTYGIFGDLTPHLHIHIVPKYNNRYGWGRMFEMHNENFKWLSDEELQKRADVIKKYMEEQIG